MAKHKTNPPRYSVGTWDTNAQAYTPQVGAGRCINLSWKGLLRTLRRLRELGYTAHRFRDSTGNYSSDHDVLVERTDGLTKAQILERWSR